MKRRLYDKKNESRQENIVERILNRSIPNRLSRIKVTDDNYFHPDVNNYKMLLEYDFRLNDLRNILRQYNLKTTGTKDILLSRLYNHLNLLENVICIQSCLRGHQLRKYYSLQGPGRKNRDICVNQNDFCAMMELREIPDYQFFSISDKDGHVYGFDIMSIYNLFIQGNTPENPFTKVKFEPLVIVRIIDFIRYSRILGMPINIVFNDLVANSEVDMLDLKAVGLFHKINMLGNYSNSSWFTSLNREGLIFFVKELMDIWDYRANLSTTTKMDICSPYGNPFKNIVSTSINNYEYLRIKKVAIKIINSMVCDGIDEENRKLGAFYVLCGLTLVNIDAANALPWLYQSVMHD